MHDDDVDVRVAHANPLHQVICPHCQKINVTTARTKKRCTFCKRYFDPVTGGKTPGSKKAKYNAQRVTRGALTFDSKAEERRYYQLRNDPNVRDVEVHPTYEIFPAVRKCLHCKRLFELPTAKCPNLGCGRKLLTFRSISYVADFKVTYKDGRVEIEDVKGVETEVFKIKRKLFEAAYPDLTLTVVRVR